VSERFELPAAFCGVLRYEDCDGDLISVSTDEEVEEALRLCGDGKTLKMTLTAAQGLAHVGADTEKKDEPDVGKAWAGALSNVFEEKDVAAQVAAAHEYAADKVSADVCPSPSSHTSMSSASGDFEMVDENDSRPASVRSSAAASQAAADDEVAVRADPADEEDEALQAALKASADQAAFEEDLRAKAAQKEEERMNGELLAAEEAAAKAACEAARKAAQESAEQVARDEEACCIAEAARIAQDARIVQDARVAEEARIAEEASRKAAQEIIIAEEARIAEEACIAEEARVVEEALIAEEASRKAAQELAEQIARDEADAQAAEVDEKMARLDIAFAAAEEDALRRADELFNLGSSVDQIRALYSEGILLQLRLVPRMSDVHSQVPAVPEPVVNWEEARAVAEQLEEERFPSQAQAAVVDEAGNLAARLTAFYFEHNALMLETVGDVSRKFVGKEIELNDALRRKYQCDLTSMAEQQAAAVAEQADADSVAARRMVWEQEEEFADAHSDAASVASVDMEPMSDVVWKAMGLLEGMGFTDRAVNLELLKKHNNVVEATINELVC